MTAEKPISANRIEAFSDGVIAIIITVMVFDIKPQVVPNEENVWVELRSLAPKIISYSLSFLMLAIMWVNHHQLFQQVKHSDVNVIWLNIHLLFWMSLVPFSTNFIGANYHLSVGSFIYGIVFLLNVMAFTLLRRYMLRKQLFHSFVRNDLQLKITRNNTRAMAVYFIASLLAFISVYVSFILFLAVPLFYFIPATSNYFIQPEKIKD